MSLESLQKQIARQNQNRQTWSEHDDPSSLAKQIREESDELVTSVENFDLLPNGVFEVASELGDVLYLALKMCNDLGLDPAQVVELKLMRNAAKYPDALLNNGWDYDTARVASKELWNHLGGDSAFYHWYLQSTIGEPPADSPPAPIPNG
jgi:NTP pyrophosphatase (non-canonical NTP hydrolase)